MKVLASFLTSFLSALAAVLVVMLAFTFFDSRPFKPLIAVGIAIGVGLANAIRARKELPLNSSALLLGALAALGSMVGTWFSNG